MLSSQLALKPGASILFEIASISFDSKSGINLDRSSIAIIIWEIIEQEEETWQRYTMTRMQT